MLTGAGRVAMISGAARGIGRHTLERLLAGGWSISAGIRDPAGLTPSDALMLHRYDAEDPASPAAWVAATLERFGALHAVVAAAGISTKATIADPDETALDAMWTVNAKAPLRLARAALPALRASGHGRIVNVASLSGKRVANANVGYAMSKFAVMALTQALRREEWEHGVRACAVCPGFVATDMTAAADFPRDAMTDPADVAILIETALNLPNNATVGQIAVNCRAEVML